MQGLSRFIVAALAICSALPASATPTQTTFAANAATAVFDCPWNAAHTDCQWGNMSYDSPTTLTSTSVSAASSDSRGTATASASIDGGSYLPSLHAFASSNPSYQGPAGAPFGGSARADANVWAVQGYQYVGATPFLLTVSAQLDSVFSRPDADLQGNHSSFSISIFDTAGYSFAYQGLDARAVADICPISPNRYCTGTPTIFDHAAQWLGDSGTIGATVSYLLEPGQEFYVGALLDASVCCGVTVDSSHTLSMQFNDASMLVSRSVDGAIAVPEPGSAYLVGAALLAIVASSRSRRSQRPGGRT